MFKILCLIPARSGSKGIPNKNIKNFKGKPLLAWSIEQARESTYNMRIVVSTDSLEYKSIAEKYGAEVPFLRPEKISKDLSNDYEFINHALSWLEKYEHYKPDIILQLRPTQPCRKVRDIDKCLDLFIQNYNAYDSLRTVVEYEKSPYKMYKIKDKNLIPLYKELNGVSEPFNQCRQILPKTYLHNGYIDIIKVKIIKDGKISGEKIYPFVMEKNDTIDMPKMSNHRTAESSPSLVRFVPNRGPRFRVQNILARYYF